MFSLCTVAAVHLGHGTWQRDRLKALLQRIDLRAGGMVRRISLKKQERAAPSESPRGEQRGEDQPLIESELRYRRLFETAPEGILILDAQDGTVIDANPSWTRLLGFSRAEIEGKRLGEPGALVTDDGRSLAAAAAEALKGTRREDLTLTARDGRALEVELTAYAYPVGDRRVVQLDLRDITARRRAERELRDSLARYRGTLDSLLEGCQIIDSSYRYLYVNKAAARQVRSTTGRLLNRTMMECFPGVESTQFYWAVWSCLNDRIPQRVESEFLFPDGSVGWFNVFAQPVPEGTFVLTVDITDRKLAEERARASQERFEIIAHTIDEVFWMADVGLGKLFYVSPAYERLWGRSRESLYENPKSFLDGIHPEDLPKVVADLALQNEGRPFSHEYRLTRPDGSTVWISDRGFPLFDANGATTRFVGVAQETTARKQAESDMARRLAELEAVSKISTSLRAAQTVEQMLPVLLDVTTDVLQVENAAIWLYDPSQDEVRVAVHRGYGQKEGLPPPPPEPPGHGIAGFVFESGKPDFTHDIRSDPRLPESVRRTIPPEISQATAPIMAGDRVIGAFSVSAEAPRKLTPTALHLLLTLSEIAGNAIHRTRLHEQTNLRLGHLAALRQVDIAITSGFDLRGTLDAVLAQVVEALGVDAAEVLVLDPASRTLQYAAGRGFQSPAAERTRLRLGEGTAGRAALERATVCVPDLRSNPEFSRTALARTEGFVFFSCAPLVTKGQLKGVLEVFRRSPLEPDQEWRDFLTALAGQTAIAIENSTLFASLQRSTDELIMAYDATIEGWSRALDLRDKETEGHTQRVTEMTLALARAYGLGDQELAQIRWGALLHDIGKMGVPDAILLKPGPLSEEEWTIMKLHPKLAFEMLSPIRYLRHALDIPYCHHEKWDGSGYPRGLKEEQIPIAARLFAVVDVWDALRSDRPYRRGWSEDEVLDHIANLSGSHFDPTVVKTFLRLVETQSP